jgi:ADP-ribosylglycohydrolase
MFNRGRLITGCCGVLLLSGCANGAISSRGLIDAGAAAGGGFIANKLTHGNSIATVAAAAGTGIAADVAQGAIQTQTEKKLEAGYNLGRSDATKQLYWATQRAQGGDDSSKPMYSEYQIPLPEQTVDGVIYQPTTKTLRISE